MKLCRVLRILFASAVVFLAPLQAQVQAELRPSGNELLSWCEEPEVNTYSFACLVHLKGIMYTHFFAVSSGRQPLYCKPSTVTTEQTRHITVKYLRAHPEWLHFPGTFLVIHALVEAFPCTQ
jgi:Rap1a immunity proteins